MNYRLRQLMGCEVEVQLENDETVRGVICYVGSNFVELLTECPANKREKGSKKHSFILSTDRINKFRYGYDDLKH
ncbi:hypothetical protein [Lentibacillus sp. Marseille-P4043]|uniref:hypothetical protein n=1 Tax=Lentibacillus sp. Marseille-P4043 TaxID=2040293 RepID=UPI00131A54A9|nr:hypothetical protein [Lentibacillus sp. Marseille-P4043]